MAAVKVVRFQVQHDGKSYKAGEIIKGLTDKQADKLVRESNGEIEKVEVVVETVKAAAPEEDAETPKEEGKTSRGKKG